MKIRILLLSALLTLTQGCGLMGAPKPETFSQQLAVGLISTTAARTLALTLLEQSIISVGDAKNVQASANAAREGIDIARTLLPTDPQAARTKLDASVLVLSTSLKYLCSYAQVAADPSCAIARKEHP